MPRYLRPRIVEIDIDDGMVCELMGHFTSMPVLEKVLQMPWTIATHLQKARELGIGDESFVYGKALDFNFTN